MTQALVISVIVGSLGAALFGALELRQQLRRRSHLLERLEKELHGRERFGPENDWPRPWIADFNNHATSLVVLIAASLSIAAVTALVDAKVSESNDPQATSTTASTSPPALDGSEDDAFSGPTRTRDRVPRRKGPKGLCLMRYTDRSTPLPWKGGQWWTSCKTGESLVTIEDVKDALALPARFGAVRDARTRALVPPGTRISYREGRAAPQCEQEVAVVECHARVYGGGAWQYSFSTPGLTRRWIVAVECTTQREDKPSAWVPC